MPPRRRAKANSSKVPKSTGTTRAAASSNASKVPRSTSTTRAAASSSAPKVPKSTGTTRAAASSSASSRKAKNSVDKPKADSNVRDVTKATTDEITPALPRAKAGTKRKQASASDSGQNKVAKQNNAKKLKTAKQQPKSAAKRRAHAPPQYEEVWKNVYLAGTEWDQLKDVYDIDWEFDHLDDMLTEGEHSDKKVYLFGTTEPQLIQRDEKDSKGEVIPVPVIVAVISDVAPPDTVGIKSVQRAEEEIVPMSEVRMGWHAYAPDNVSLTRRFQPNVFVLKCNERRARLRNMSEADTHKYDYVLPYFIKPDQVNNVDEDTNVQVLAELEGRNAPLMCEYDYEMDDFDDFLEETIKENDLDPSKHTEPLKKAIREAVKTTKLKYKKEREERQKRVDAISSTDREAMKNMKLLKFYPENEWPDVSKVKSSFINRYYGHATKVM